MASCTSKSHTGGTGSSHRSAGGVSGLADSRVREAGSGHRGESNEHPTKFRAATWNVGTLKKRGSEVVETLTRRRVDLCCVQEHRWAGSLSANQTRQIKGKDSIYKFFWSGNDRGLGGAGILLAEKWVDKVFDVQRVSDRIILMRLVIGKVVFTFLSVYAPQSGLSETEKERFYDQLQGVVTKIPASEILVPSGDWNGHVGAKGQGFEEVHGGRGFGIRNTEGERVLEFALANDLVIGNTCFIKRDSHLITYCSSNHRTQIDYILYRKSFRKSVQNVKVVPIEECIQQHNLVVCDFTVSIPTAKKRKFIPRIRTWKLRDQTVANEFHATFKDKVTDDANMDSVGSVEDVWARFKNPLLETASEVCGLSKNHRWKRETWWRDDRVEDAVKAKRVSFKTYKALVKAGNKTEATKAKAAYNEAKRQQNMRFGRQSQKLRRNSSLTSLRMIAASSSLQNKWTGQIRMLWVKSVLRMMRENYL
ncbi:craniofacial development protein 2-like [Mercenaria mercenaria]|uniref:craniofacial development protein 2-like n=1 Tax=Mercenaria mercenaria TaxID=6596 RepID=UPI00234EA755|nr:craniofacial development protein 2-like [Mercenaria mercenaria]